MKNNRLIFAAICALLLPLTVSCSDNGSDNLSSGNDGDEARIITQRSLDCQEIEDTQAQIDCLTQIQQDFADNSIR